MYPFSLTVQLCTCGRAGQGLGGDAGRRRGRVVLHGLQRAPVQAAVRALRARPGGGQRGRGTRVPGAPRVPRRGPPLGGQQVCHGWRPGPLPTVRSDPIMGYPVALTTGRQASCNRRRPRPLPSVRLYPLKRYPVHHWAASKFCYRRRPGPHPCSESGSKEVVRHTTGVCPRRESSLGRGQVCDRRRPRRHLFVSSKSRKVVVCCHMTLTSCSPMC